MSVIACIAGAGKTKLFIAILIWVYHILESVGNDKICITYCAPTQELVKQTMADFREAIPERDRDNVAWGYGFDRANSVDRLQQQLKVAVAG